MENQADADLTINDLEIMAEEIAAFVNRRIAEAIENLRKELTND